MNEEKQSFLTLFDEFKRKAEPLLEKLSQLRKSTIFPILFHLQASIAPWCVSKVYDAILQLNEKELENVDVIVFSLGGDADAAYHIGRMLHKHVKGNLTFIVSRIAASAATLLTFAGNKILMLPSSQLGPIDPQIEVAPGRYVSARSLREATELIITKIVNAKEIPKSTVEGFLEKLPLLEVVDYERLLNHTMELATNLLKLRMMKEDEKTASRIAEIFVKKFGYHERCITVDECREIGLKVEEPTEEELATIWEFTKLWEEFALLRARLGSKIYSLRIGKGIAFIPAEKEENSEPKETPIDVLIEKLTRLT